MARTRGGNHRVNAGYTLLARLVPERVAEAERLLRGHAERDDLPFAAASTTHFATLTVIPEQRYGDERLPATLMVATSFAGPVRAHVSELRMLMDAQLRALFACCEAFAPGCSGEELEKFILAHRHGDTFYSGMQHLAPEDVTQHQQLRAAIDRFVDERRPEGTALEVKHQIQDHVRELPGFEWAREAFAPPPSAWWAQHWRSLVALAIALPILALIAGAFVGWLITRDGTLGAIAAAGGIVLLGVVAFVIALVVGVRHAETLQTYVAQRQADDHVRTLARTQNRPVINEMTICGPIKEGAFRPMFMQLALWIVARVAEGLPFLRLAINIPTVATARWIAADRGRRLIFISNYTNAAEPYVRDFIDIKNGAKRINLTFGFGRGYPKTEWVVDGGALADPNAFIYVVTEAQHITQYWYGRYGDLSIDNIKLDRQIREGLFAPHSLAEAQAWLHLLGGSFGEPRDPAVHDGAEPKEVLDLDDIQGLVVRGYGKLKSARLLLLTVADADKARAYLRTLCAPGQINRASESDPPLARQIAFTAPGLAALGVGPATLATFAREFLEGMNDEVRADGLRDPHGLAWGERDAHVLLAIYADTEDALATELAAQRRAMGDAFSRIVEKDSQLLPDNKEHFGWRDGLSMPKIEGVKPEGAGQGKKHQQTWTQKPIRPGEFVLGYLNEYSCYSESPVAGFEEDPHGHLHVARDGAHKDVGKNGTYLVYRELTQNVGTLWSHLAEHSREPGANPTERAVALGAKMVGRWPGGAPLSTSATDDPARATDNGFTFREDPAGLRCPLGAHIRRANPRDMLAADRDQDDSVEMVRKHQMIRRGRPFGAPISDTLDPAAMIAHGPDAPDAPTRGLHFLCLVGHISRQFEFVQRAWIHAPNFAALAKDGDPLTAHRVTGANANNEFTCPAEPVRRKYTGLPQFTTLVGGGYFFLPGLRALRFIARLP